MIELFQAIRLEASRAMMTELWMVPFTREWFYESAGWIQGINAVWDLVHREHACTMRACATDVITRKHTKRSRGV